MEATHDRPANYRPDEDTVKRPIINLRSNGSGVYVYDLATDHYLWPDLTIANAVTGSSWRHRDPAE